MLRRGNIPVEKLDATFFRPVGAKYRNTSIKKLQRYQNTKFPNFAPTGRWQLFQDLLMERDIKKNRDILTNPPFFLPLLPGRKPACYYLHHDQLLFSHQSTSGPFHRTTSFAEMIATVPLLIAVLLLHL